MAQQDTIDKIINIQFNYRELVQGWAAATREIEINKKNLTELKQEYKNGEMSATEYNKAILEITSTTKALTAEKKAYEKEIQNNIKIETRASGSINQLRANVSKLTTQYNELSATEREGKFGQRLAKDIKSQQEAINSAEQALGNYRSKVGSYEDAIKNVLGLNNQFTNSLLEATTEGNGFASVLNTVGAALWNITKKLASFIATPVGMFLAGLAAAYYLVSSRINEMNNRIKESETLFYQNEKAQSYARAYMDAYTRQIDKQAAGWILAKGAMSSYWTKLKQETKALIGRQLPFGSILFPNVSISKKEIEEGAKQRMSLVEQEEALQIRRREINLENAEIESKIADARLKAMDKEKYSATERNKYAKEAIDLNNKYYDNLESIAKEEKTIADLRVSFTNSSTAELDAQNEAAVKLIRLDAQRAASQLDLVERINSTNTEIKTLSKEVDKQQKTAEAAAKRATIQFQKNLGQQLKAEQDLLSAVQSLREKTQENELKSLQENYDKDIEAYWKKLSEENIDTDTAYQMLLAMEEKYQKDRQGIIVKYSRQNLDEQVRQQELAFQLAVAKMNPQNDKERLSAAKFVAESELKIAKDKLVWISNLTEEQQKELYENGLQYQNARLQAEIELQNAINKTGETEKQINMQRITDTQQLVSAISGAAGSFSSMFDALGGEGERYAAFAKTFAVFQVALAQASAIANAVAAGANGAPWFLLPITIASSVAAVIAAIAQATQQLDSTQSPKYASGGLITGPGTGTSDSIVARVSNGEAIMTAQAVNDWGAVLSAMNVSSGGNAIQVSNLPQRGDGMRGVEQMMERVLLNLPSPIVLVKDIDNGQRRVKVAANLAKLGRKK